MDSTIIVAIAAACGSLVGAAATIVTTWITQRTQTVHAEREAKLRVREALYGEFITEASRLTIDAVGHSLETLDTFVKLYGILGRIRLVAANSVLDAAEACIRQIIDLFAKPNMTVEQMRLAFERDRLDPIREFSVASRKELIEIARGG
jgi:transcription-repair coupling factor (superfamily II helicase)